MEELDKVGYKMWAVETSIDRLGCEASINRVLKEAKMILEFVNGDETARKMVEQAVSHG